MLQGSGLTVFILQKVPTDQQVMKFQEQLLLCNTKPWFRIGCMRSDRKAVIFQSALPQLVGMLMEVHSSFTPRNFH